MIRSLLGLLGARRRPEDFPSAPRPVRVLVFGDSNTARPHAGGGRWTDLVQGRLKPCVELLNEGLDGRTTAFDEAERNGAEVLTSVLAARSPVHHLILMLGTNDLKVAYGPPGPQAIVAGVDELVRLSLSIEPRLRIMLLTPPPMGRVVSPEFERVNRPLAETAAGIERLAARRALPCVDLHSKLDVSRHLERDGVHLNRHGRRAVARAVEPALAREIDAASRSRSPGSKPEAATPPP